MVTVIHDEYLAEQMIAQRRAWGADHHDEVWEGVYMMSPLADDEHQDLVAQLTAILIETVQRPKLGQVRPGVNVSDRRRDWNKNYRCPDVVVRLENGQATICDAYWLGGPDFLIEIVSPDDQTYEKLPFYESIGTSEVLVIDRRPWALVLYQLTDGKLIETARSTVEDSALLASAVIPLTYRLLPGQARPQIEVTHAASGQRWII